MARILYSAAGEGYGHAVRAHSVGAGLLARGHDVRFLTSRSTIRYLSDFYPKRLHEVFGLHISYHNERVSAVRTLLGNAMRATREMGTSNAVVKRLLRSFRPDLLVCDFEPFSANWARLMGVPFVSLDNQHMLTHCRVAHLPGYRLDLLNTWATVRFYYAGARRYLIPTIFDVPVVYQPASVVPPVLREAVYARTPTDGKHLVAYRTPAGDPAKMMATLEAFDRFPIRAYGFDFVGTRGHVEYRPISQDGFLEDLATCRGVIATAGHSLICECVYFEKPMLLMPMRSQYEQMFNAQRIDALGLGISTDELRATDLERFADSIDSFRNALSRQNKPELAPVLDAIEAEIT